MDLQCALRRTLRWQRLLLCSNREGINIMANDREGISIMVNSSRVLARRGAGAPGISAIAIAVIQTHRGGSNTLAESPNDRGLLPSRSHFSFGTIVGGVRDQERAS